MNGINLTPNSKLSKTAQRSVVTKSKDARAMRTAQSLKVSLLALLEIKNFDQITVREICEKTGIHYTTFFRRYASKEALLDDIAKHEIEFLHLLTVKIRSAADYHAGFHALCAYVDEHRDLWSTLFNGGAGPAMKEEWLRLSKMVALSEPRINTWLHPELGAICAATLIAETLAWWVAQPAGAQTVDEMAGVLLRLVNQTAMAPD